MANSYENTIMPERPNEQLKPDAIPVDDKGRPLPDPTESLSNYIAPKGVEELRKAYSELEVDENVRNTMEPPQKTGLLRKHRSGSKRGYEYYGTPAGSIPNDSNGLKPSPLSQLFSEAEALEPDFDLDKIRDHVLQNEPEPGSEFTVVETPKLNQTAKNQNGESGSKDDLLKRTEVVKDPNAPKFLDLYKESTNTKVIYQSDGADGASYEEVKARENAQDIFAEHSRVTKAKKHISKREEKKAIKAAIKLEKKKSKERRKAEKAARKAKKKGKNVGVPEDKQVVTNPEEIAKLQEDAAKKVAEEKLRLENEAKSAQIAAEQEKQKEAAKLEAQRAAREAEKLLQKEKEALRRQEEETKAAELEKEKVMRQLEEEKEAARKAAEEAAAAREETEKLKAELEKMKAAAAQALAQKQEAEKSAESDRAVKNDAQTEQEKAEKASAKKISEESPLKTKAPAAKPKSAGSSKNSYATSPTMEVVKRRLAEMEAQLSSKE